MAAAAAAGLSYAETSPLGGADSMASGAGAFRADSHHIPATEDADEFIPTASAAITTRGTAGGPAGSMEHIPMAIARDLGATAGMRMEFSTTSPASGAYPFPPPPALPPRNTALGPSPGSHPPSNHAAGSPQQGRRGIQLSVPVTARGRGRMPLTPITRGGSAAAYARRQWGSVRGSLGEGAGAVPRTHSQGSVLPQVSSAKQVSTKTSACASEHISVTLSW